ncbi:hypothetical protein [Paraburkholderia ginsengisoli]|uniref:Type I restriction endonuclease subunit M n=1 Tax=Paraburkholderia ginsengisoli TaxID=311231 RepID=A0A7T4N332_9BURK|nr:hypothetical protein [Paraburkholderia ginsengisoli]QQC64366.1 hypothetical protein I6I06_02410 [Paraburkholderia ginsengisoli]
MAEETLFSLIPNARFSPGRILMTIGINELVQQGRFNPGSYLHRHLSGDWGDVGLGGQRRNDAALISGEDRLFSCYQGDSDLTFWIITEWDRSVTTLLLPNEY